MMHHPVKHAAAGILRASALQARCGRFSTSQRCWAPAQMRSGRSFATQSPNVEEPQTCNAILSACDSKFLATPFAPRAFAALRLSSFTGDDLKARFKQVDLDGSGELSRDEVLELFRQTYAGRSDDLIEKRAQHMASVLMRHLDRDGDKKISFQEFQTGITELAEKRDPRMWPIAGMMLFTGLSVGVVIPAMPVVVKLLGLSQAEFGYVISAFGLSKLLGNVPAGICVATRGRRVAMSGGLVVCGFGTAGVGVANSLAALVGARFVTGIGASYTMAGATTAASDLSTPLNRTRVLAPVLTAFSAGTVLGPAVGGMLISSIGLESTFAIVGGMFLANALATQTLMPETLKEEHKLAGTTSTMEATRAMFKEWKPLFADSEIRAALAVNTAYWVALAGGQMTLLPLLLADQFALGPAEIGAAFALQSAVSVVVAGPAASIADRMGPQHIVAPALTIMAASFAAMPVAPGITELAVPLICSAIGSTMLSSAPVALVSNLVGPQSRAQGLALTRAMGDAGWLMGGASIGAIATLFGTGPALQGVGSFLLSTAAWFAYRTLVRKR